ncbi:TetR/AcrR family transcriptional regulator [Micromonospora sp. NPDC050980]|uniref:TetR/AcrR family transcriptional regulator n=1 Tax=Micromonospora sp. NPDC050980 TaxID=3155161 RepID=UPI0033EAE9DF
MTATRAQPPRRSTYRHGDLRRALLEAGVAMARDGGPHDVVLRAVTRRVGVAPNAAYRHFADRRALLEAVSASAQAALARTIEEELAKVPTGGDPAARARARLRAVGTGYLTFATTEPGLFRTAISVPVDLTTADEQAKRGDSGLAPFQLLGAALDELVAAGALPAQRRPQAEFLAWSTVHGLAMLLIDGPLRALDRAAAGDVGQRLLDMVERGI